MTVVKGDIFDKIKGIDLYDNSELIIDFGKIIPVPDDILQGDLTMEQMQQTKGRNWYDWNIKNWGTKWNAYMGKKVNNHLTFQTAWTMPEPIYKALAVMFPEAEIYVQYADEDYGSNCGTVTIKDGKCIISRFDENLDFALEVWEVDKAEYLKEIEEDSRE